MNAFQISKRCVEVGLLAALFLLPVGCGGTAGSGTASALKLVPNEALAVVVVNDLSRIDKVVGDVARLTKQLVPLPVSMLKGVLGIKEGFDEKGTLVVTVMPGQPLPQGFVLVPVTNYKKFVESLKGEDAGKGVNRIFLGDKPGFVTAKGNFAILASVPETTEKDLLAFAAATGNVASLVSSGSAWMAEQDAYVIATPAGVKAAIGPMRQGLQQAKKSFPQDNPQFQQVQAMFGMYDKLFELCEGDLEYAAMGLRSDRETNLHATSRWQFKSGSAAAKTLTDVKAPAGKPLTKLPNGPLVVAGAGAMPEGLVTSSLSVIEAMAPPGKLTKEQLEKARANMAKSMAGVHSMSMSMGIPKSGGLYSEMLGVIDVEDADKYVANLKDSFAGLSEFYNAASIPGWSEPQVNAVEIKGQKAIEVTMDLSASMQTVNDPRAKEMIEKMFGNGGKMTFTYVAVDKTTVLTVYSGGADAVAKVAAWRDRKGSLADNADVSKTLGLLIKDPQWYGIWDLPGTMQFVTSMMKMVGGDNGPVPLPTIPACPPIGFAAKAINGALETDLVVPAGTMSAAAGAIKKAETAE